LHKKNIMVDYLTLIIIILLYFFILMCIIIITYLHNNIFYTNDEDFVLIEYIENIKDIEKISDN
jgi:hypothetical protein